MTTFGLQLPDFSWLVGAEPATSMSRIRDAVGRERGDVKRTCMVTLFVRPQAEVDGIRAMLNYDGDENVHAAMIIATRQQAHDQLAALRATGVDEIIVNLPLINSVDSIHDAADLLAEVCK